MFWQDDLEKNTDGIAEGMVAQVTNRDTTCQNKREFLQTQKSTQLMTEE